MLAFNTVRARERERERRRKGGGGGGHTLSHCISIFFSFKYRVLPLLVYIFPFDMHPVTHMYTDVFFFSSFNFFPKGLQVPQPTSEHRTTSVRCSRSCTLGERFSSKTLCRF